MMSFQRSHATTPRTESAPQRARRGQSLVELSLVLPMMLLLLLGTLDLGRAFFDYIQLRNAAREGAAYGARFPTDSAGISQRVTSHGVPSGTAVSSVCSGTCTAVDGVGKITVTASRTFTPITTAFLQSYFGIAPFQMQATASARVMS